MHKANHPKKPTVKFILIAFLIGLLVGALGIVFAQMKGIKLESVRSENVSIVFDRVKSENELVVASQKYVAVEKVSDSNSLFNIEIPFTENSYWYRYVGTIKAAVNLSEAVLVGQEGTNITIALSQPYISSNTPDMEESCVLEEHNNILNPIHLKEVDAYRKQCVEKLEKEAMEGDLLSEARANAEVNLNSLFKMALGDEYHVQVQWEEAQEGVE